MPQPKPYNGNEPYLFVSYSRKDKEQVFPIIEYLQENGFRIWYDDGIIPSEKYADVIAEKLEECSYHVSFFSNNFYNSRYCRSEIGFAHDLKKQILIIFLHDEPMPLSFNLKFNNCERLDYFRYSRMDAFLNKILGIPYINICRSKKDNNAPKKDNKASDYVKKTSAQKPKAYTGNQPYLFISYSRDDSTEVYSIIEYLQKKGFRVWYDEGIRPGTPNFYDEIADRIDNCGIFIAFLSNNFYGSRDCKNEIFSAYQNEEEISSSEEKLLIIYLRDEPMIRGMKLLYSLIQNIRKYDYPDMDSFYEKLLETPNIEECRVKKDQPDPDGYDPFNVYENYLNAIDKQKAPSEIH